MIRLFCLSILFIFVGTSIQSQAQMPARYVPGEVIVKYKKKDSDGKEVSFATAHSRVSSKRKLREKRRWKKFNTANYKINSKKTVSEVVQELNSDPDVEYAEPNYYVSITHSIKESETFHSIEDAQSYAIQTYHEEANGLPYGQTGASIAIPEAWNQLSFGKPEVVVAIIDTGIDFRNTLLSNARWINTNEIPGDGIDNDHNGFIDDVSGWNFVSNNNNPNDCNDHGTHVAGIVRGATQNIIGIDPPSPADTRIKLMALKFLDCDGVGTTSDAIQAIYYAASNGARILNNSWGGGGYSTALHEAIAYTYSKNVLFVAAAGNNTTNIDAYPAYPASYNVPNVISIGASTTYDNIAYFSNYGIHNVHLGSPGVGVLSTVACNTYDTNCAYTASMSGTSMAAPFVAGIAAMMAYEQPTMTGYQIRSLLKDAQDIPMIGASPALAGKVKDSGRVNASNSVYLTKIASVDGTTPRYDVSAHLLRAPASQKAAGCGLVQNVYEDNSRGPQPPPHPLMILLTLSLLGLPIALALVLSKNPKNQRRFQRFHMPSQVHISMNGSNFMGQVGTISLGGLSFNSDAVLQLGNPVHMEVSSLSGDDSLQVSGQIVWMSNSQSYGVKFTQTEEQALVKIGNWIQNLKKAS